MWSLICLEQDKVLSLSFAIFQVETILRSWRFEDYKRVCQSISLKRWGAPSPTSHFFLKRTSASSLLFCRSLASELDNLVAHGVLDAALQSAAPHIILKKGHQYTQHLTCYSPESENVQSSVIKTVKFLCRNKRQNKTALARISYLFWAFCIHKVIK